MKQKTKKFNNTKKNDQIMAQKIYVQINIILEIHIWHFFCHIKLIFNKIEEGFINVY
jgi:hypothetical protein